MTPFRACAWLTSLAIVLAIAGCGYNDKVTAVRSTPLAQVMVVLASPDTPTTAAFLDGVSADSALSYLNNSPYLATAETNTHLQLYYEDNKNPPDRFVALDTSVPVATGGSYTIFAADSLSRLGAVVLQDDLSLPPAGKARVRFVHCLPGYGNVDFAISGGAILAAAVPFKGTGGWQLMDQGSYNLEARPAGDPTTQIADITGLSFAGGHVYTVWLYGPVFVNAPVKPGFQTIVHH
jgi:hypothetical protein